MIKEDRKDQVREILLLPIRCDSRHDGISRIDNKIKTGQKYYATLDEDMSDFAMLFYNIIYKDILKSKPILDNNGFLFDREFAGDTMNSFNMIANTIPEAGKSCKTRTAKEKWPEYLRNYHSKYHCLANFWLLPMEIGRTMRGELNKARNPISDYMDRFLVDIRLKIKFDERDRKFFKYFKNWSDFTDKHFIKGSYVCAKTSKVYSYSNFDEGREENFTEKALRKIERRAECISKSEYAEELWKCFDELRLFKE